MNISMAARLWAPIALSLLLAGCILHPDAIIGVENAVRPADSVSGARPHEIFVTTTRRRAGDDTIMFSGDRANETSLARVTVFIPPDHVAGKVERPKRLPPDPKHDFVVADPVDYGGDEQFIAAIDKALAARPVEDREVLVFVHGYNTSFASAVMRLAQFVEDSGFKGVPVLFSWASRGKTVDYVYDMNSALGARSALLDVASILSRTTASSFAILAHSMGNLLTVEAIHQAQLLGRYNKLGKLRTVILASPDIDLDLFRRQISTLQGDRRNIFVLLSHDDAALAVSRKIAGGIDRVGDARPTDLASTGVTVIDLSKVEDGAGLNHAKFADAPQMVKLIGIRLNAGDQLDTPGVEADGRKMEQLSPGVKVKQAHANVFSLAN